MKILVRVLGLVLALGWLAGGPVLSEGAWEALGSPDTSGGLVLSPRMESGAGRLQMAWGWTNDASKILEPEFTYLRSSTGRPGPVPRLPTSATTSAACVAWAWPGPARP